MEVIFLQDVKNSGRRGDIKQISDGFARNFLIPHKLAAPSTAVLKRKFQQEREREKKKTDGALLAKTELVAQLRGLTISFKEKASATGTLFGGITTERISEELKRVTGSTIDPESITLEKPLKHGGRFPVTLTVGQTECTILVNINQ